MGFIKKKIKNTALRNLEKYFPKFIILLIQILRWQFYQKLNKLKTKIGIDIGKLAHGQADAGTMLIWPAKP